MHDLPTKAARGACPSDVSGMRAAPRGSSGRRRRHLVCSSGAWLTVRQGSAMTDVVMDVVLWRAEREVRTFVTSVAGCEVSDVLRCRCGRMVERASKYSCYAHRGCCITC